MAYRAIVFREVDTRDALYVMQQTSLGLGELSIASGKLYKLPITADGRPGTLAKLWESRPAELPDLCPHRVGPHRVGPHGGRARGRGGDAGEQPRQPDPTRGADHHGHRHLDALGEPVEP